MEKKGTRWGWTIFWLIVFWPVGLFLVFKKLGSDKSALMSGKTGGISAAGWILTVLGVSSFLGSLFNPEADPSGVGIGLMMIAGGVVILKKASNTKRTAIKYKKYIDLTVNQNVRSIDDIASSTGVSYDIAVKDLQNMIDLGYLRDASIHQDTREIILYQYVPVLYAQESTNVQTSAQEIAVKCPGCGANNVVVVGKVSECEYCGTPMNA